MVINGEVSEETAEAARGLASEDDGTKNLEGELVALEEPGYVLNETLVFTKVTGGFFDAAVLLLKALSHNGFEINMPSIIIKMESGAYRIYLLNDHDLKYHRAFVKSDRAIYDYRTVTSFPILPPRWVSSASKSLHHDHKVSDGDQYSFDIKVQPAGVTVVEFKCK